ncbi:MAG: hypothetical protein IPI48_02900 [bacterium]|nr:hypothetical protein [bacterium]
MRNKHLLLALAVLFLPPALAGAGTLEALTATADCNAWSAEATVAFRPGATMVLLLFDMQLADSVGVVIEDYHWEQWLEIPATATATYPFGAAWQTPLDRSATMIAFAEVYDARGDVYSLTQGEVVTPLACNAGGGTPEETCRHAARWWLRHRSQWPVTALSLGQVEYDAGQLTHLLRGPHRGQVARRLAHQLAVAKLNLANGVTNDIAESVAAADAWLVAHPLDSRSRHQEPRNNERRAGLRLIKNLCQWNHSGCPDGSQILGDDDEETGKDGLTLDFGDSNQEFTGDLADFEVDEKAAEEVTNLGTLKAMFR